MAGRAAYFQSHRITLAQQAVRMRSLYPQFESTVRPARVAWIGLVRPAPLTEQYRVRIEYTLSTSPDVWVLSPPLRGCADDPVIPHVYPGPRPCPYLPGSGEWSLDQFVADTIVPWTSLWLYHYEVWHATGEWLGGGVHPKTRQVED